MLKRIISQFDPRISEELYAQRGPIVKGLLCAVGASGLLALVGLLIKEVLGAIEQGAFERMNLLAVAVFAVFAVKYFFTRGQSYFLSAAASQLTTELRRRLYAKLLRLPVSYFNAKRSGSIQSVLTNDVNIYQTAITVLKDAVDGPIKVVAGLAIILYMQWQLTLAAMLVMPLMVYFVQRNARKMKVVQAEVQEDLGTMTAFMQETMQGTRIIKAFGAEEATIGRFRQHTEKTLQSQLRAARRVSTLKPLVELIGALALAIVVFVCGWLAKNGQLGVADLGAFLYTLDFINKGVQSMGAVKQTKAQVQAASERIHREILDEPVQIEEHALARELSVSRGEVEFHNVSFAYPDGTEAVKNVSFKLQPGESLALVGPSGAGKSTIADLLLRFYDPTSGMITYDGVDIRELSTNWYRAQIGVVPQTTFLFAGSISENIRLALPEASEDQVQEAAGAAHAADFISDLQDGYSTELGERGVRLSGGQAQRIAIARALVRKPRVILLDEATSNLDPVSEQAVQEALDEIMPGRTTLLIVHRLTTAARASKIVVLRRGEILEDGTFKELMDQNGAFASMYRAFVAGGESGS